MSMRRDIGKGWRGSVLAAAALGGLLCAGASGAFVAPGAPPADSSVKISPLVRVHSGREAANNNQIMTTGIRSPRLPSNHALIITVSEYRRSPLPGVVTDRKLALELAQRFGVPIEQIVELSEEQVTREGLRQALVRLNQTILPGDRLYVYFSGHGARFFSKATGQCTESLVMQDMRVVTNREFADMIKPLSAKTDKTVIMLDACHSGGVAHAASSRALAGPDVQRPKYSTEASSPQCALAVNLGSFSAQRGLDLNTTDHNLVVIAAARNNEVAWDTMKGGALTYNFEQCLGGSATDSDHSGSLSIQELADCVQGRLDKTQEVSARQHVTVTGNAALVPALGDTSISGEPEAAAAAPAPSMAEPALPPPIDTMATLNDIYNQRDDRWHVEVDLDNPTVKIGGNLAMSIRSQRNGYVYVFYRGSQPDSFYLLFPNQLDAANTIAANETLRLPRNGWNVTALGPRGTDRLLVLVTETSRDFSAVALPKEYVSPSGPFDKILPTARAAAHISQLATLSAQFGSAPCQQVLEHRDLGVAHRCSNVFGAGVVNVEETD